jgi:hypothetical protein
MNTKDKDRKVEDMIEVLWNDATDNVDGDCDECKFYQRMSQRHPYGSTTATEAWGECIVPEAKDCPVVEEIVAEMAAQLLTKRKEVKP